MSKLLQVLTDLATNAQSALAFADPNPDPEPDDEPEPEPDSEPDESFR